MRIDALPAKENRLGESPIWCERTARLWWVDVLTPALWSYEPKTGATERHAVEARHLGSIALRDAGGLLLACENGLFAYDLETGAQTFLVDPEPDMPDHRKNDGRADPCGNFWIGTLEESRFAPVGCLYRVGADLSVSVEVKGLAIPNSLAFDLDRKRMYFADTRAFAIWICDFDPANGHIANPRTFAKTEAPARPDGSCVDAEGCLWNAEFAGGQIVRYSPDGDILATIDLPVSHPTCVCFGGPDLDQLFVTSASEPLDAERRAHEPLAGRVLSLDVGVHGRAEYRVRL